MKLTFYVLENDLDSQNNKSINKEESVDTDSSLLSFVCQLVHTILAKSDKQLIIFDDDVKRMQTLDALLWSYSPTSFIPHDLHLEGFSNDADNKVMAFVKSQELIDFRSDIPVVITNSLADEFKHSFAGVLLNLAQKSIQININSIDISDDNTNKKKEVGGFSCLDSLLEIIPADAVNKEVGRNKYSQYKRRGFDIVVHKINNR